MGTQDDLSALLDEAVLMRGRYASKEQFFESLALWLMDSGYVEDDYGEALKAREDSFPTGLELPNGSICIPHTEPGFVKKDGLAVVLFDRPLKFRSMEDPEKLLDAQAAFALFIADSTRHLQFLQRVVRAIQTPDLLSRLDSAIPHTDDQLAV